MISKDSTVKEFAKWSAKLKLEQHAEYSYPMELTNKYKFAISWKVLKNITTWSIQHQQPGKLAWSHRPETWKKLNWCLIQIGRWARRFLEISNLAHEPRTIFYTFRAGCTWWPVHIVTRVTHTIVNVWRLTKMFFVSPGNSNIYLQDWYVKCAFIMDLRSYFTNENKKCYRYYSK